MTLENAIARRLCISNVGLFRKQIFDQIDRTLTLGNIERVSVALNGMKVAGHVEKSTRIGAEGSRWSITPKGRAAYSVMHDDELQDDDTSTQPTEEGPILPAGAIAMETDEERDDYLPEHLQGQESAPDPTLEFLDNQKINSAFLKFDITDTLDRALYGLVKLIRDEAQQSAPAIERKAEKLALLERMENNDLLPGNVRALLGYIRMDLEQLEASE